MTEDNKKTSFEDEFDFLNEESFDDTETQAATPPPTSSAIVKPAPKQPPIKMFAILGTITVGGILAVMMLGHRPNKNSADQVAPNAAANANSTAITDAAVNANSQANAGDPAALAANAANNAASELQAALMAAQNNANKHNDALTASSKEATNHPATTDANRNSTNSNAGNNKNDAATSLANPDNASGSTNATNNVSTNGKSNSKHQNTDELDLSSLIDSGSHDDAKSRAEIAQLFNSKPDKSGKSKSLDTKSLEENAGMDATSNNPANAATAKNDLAADQNRDKAKDKNITDKSHGSTNTASKNNASAPTQHGGTQLAPPETMALDSSADNDNAEIKQSLDNINKEISQHFSQIQQLKNTLKEISSSLAKINQSIGSMDNKVIGLTETVNVLSSDITGVKKVIAAEDLDIASKSQVAQARPTLTYKAPEYVVHAIIPGRAWLKSASGQIITVAEGDVVGDYGTVAVIDAANNLVRTSSGVAFR